MLLLQGCIADKGSASLLEETKCNMSRDCKQKKEEITNTFEQCLYNPDGADITKYFAQSDSRWRSRIYAEFLVNRQFKDTNQTYLEVRNDCQNKFEAAEARRIEAENIKKEALRLKKEKEFNSNVELAKASGYEGYAEFRSIADFISEAQNGNININDYKGYVILSENSGTRAYKFSQLVEGVEMYHPDYRFGLNVSVGIKRDKEETNQPLEGQPLQNTETVSFLGVQTYRTVLGTNKQILMFDRAIDFRVAYMQKWINLLEEKVNKK